MFCERLLPNLFLLLVLAACGPLGIPVSDPAMDPASLQPAATLLPPTLTPFQPAVTSEPPTPVVAQPSATPLPPTATIAPPTATFAAPEYAAITLLPTPEGGLRYPCENIFFPFLPNAQWTYRMYDLGGTTREMRLSVGDSGMTRATIDVLNLSTGVASQAIAECQGGAILNFPLMVFGPLFGDIVTGEMTVNYVSGVFMPAGADFAAAGGYLAWSGMYAASGVLHSECVGQPFDVLLDNSPIRMSWQVVGQETITVAAGTYENAYKVNHQSVADGTLLGGSAVVPAQLTVNAVQWYAPHVGLLRNEVVSAALTAGGTTLPVLINGSGDLIAVRPGP